MGLGGARAKFSPQARIIIFLKMENKSGRWAIGFSASCVGLGHGEGYECLYGSAWRTCHDALRCLDLCSSPSIGGGWGECFVGASGSVLILSCCVLWLSFLLEGSTMRAADLVASNTMSLLCFQQVVLGPVGVFGSKVSYLETLS
jgi:hypothetical protein